MRRTRETVGAGSVCAHVSTASRARTRLLGRLTILTLAFPAIGLGTFWTSSHAPSPSRSSHLLASYRSSQSSDGSGRGLWPESPTTSTPSPTIDNQLGLAVTKYQQWMTTAFEEGVAAEISAQAAQGAARANASRGPVAVTSPIPAAPTTPVAGGSDGYSIGQWALVSECENGPGAWNPPRGPAYPDSLGLTAANWEQFGGGSDLSPAAQTAVGNRFLAAYGMAIPDQNGCGGGY